MCRTAGELRKLKNHLIAEEQRKKKLCEVKEIEE